MAYTKRILRYLIRRRWLAATAVILGLVMGGGLIALLPFQPRASWPAQGDTFFYSADGQLIATVAITYPRPKNGRAAMLSSGPPPSPDKCDLHIFDAKTGRRINVLTWKKAEVRSLAFSLANRRLAALDVWTGAIREWDLSNARETAFFDRKDFKEHNVQAHQIAYSPDGDLLAMVRKPDVSFCLWDCRRRKEFAPLAAKDEFVERGISLPGFLVAYSADKNRIKTWRIDTGELTGTFPADYRGFRSPPDITISNDGQVFLHGTQKIVRIWHADGTRREWKGVNAESRPALSPGNRYLAAYAWRNLRQRQKTLPERVGFIQPPQEWSILKLYDLNNGRELAAFPGTKYARFSPVGDTLAVLTKDDRFQIWDVPPRRPWVKIIGCAALVCVLAIVAGCLLEVLAWQAFRKRKHSP